ncbi:MAG: hypothetical protein ACLUD2_14940 [Clostridium sp.]
MREKSYIDWINDCLRRCSTSSAE